MDNLDLLNVSLPKIGYFGKPLEWDHENAQVGIFDYLVTSSWKAHNRSPDQIPRKDFGSLNKSSIVDGFVNPKVNF